MISVPAIVGSAFLCDRRVIDAASFVGHLAVNIIEGDDMTEHRIVRRHWIIETAAADAAVWLPASERNAGYNDEIIAAVRWAIDGLEPDEAEFVRMFYLRGMSYPQISALTAWPRRLQMSRHRTALKKLRLRLYKMLGGRYNVPIQLRLDCPLCDHPRIAEIDALIRTKRESETWRTIIKTLKTKFTIENVRPQILMTHRKYHIL